MLENIVLLGFMGTGKSAVGKYLAAKMHRLLIELDKEIESKAGMSIPAIFNRYGETHFRDLETAVIQEWSPKSNLVISTGGGAVLRPENQDYLRKNGLLICLTATPEAILERIQGDQNRPLLQVADKLQKIKALLADRSDIYRAVADYELDCTKLDVDQTAEHIMGYMRGWQNGFAAGCTRKE